MECTHPSTTHKHKRENCGVKILPTRKIELEGKFQKWE